MIDKTQEIHSGDYWNRSSRDYDSEDWVGGFGHGEIFRRTQKLTRFGNRFNMRNSRGLVFFFPLILYY